ncbi:C39 family peptidase [Sporosalibacterium faouarense]|uniref:C39 family peptidase n=1 Tax=Sporosalibacterium faouarense TaxID=516123 RepID=UPI00192ADFA4|nr:C39 family peptidase [Sporosalibacterium faouarense]
MLKKLGKLKWVISIVSSLAPVVLGVILLAAPIAGLYKAKSYFMNLFFGNDKEEEGIVLSLDIEPKKLEEILAKVDRKAYEELNLPISLDEINSFLDREKSTYSDNTFYYKKVRVRDVRKYDRKDNRTIRHSNKMLGYEPLKQDFKELEYEYRLPWQIIYGANFYKSEDVTEGTMKALMPKFVYVYPYSNHSIPFPKSKTADEQTGYDAESKTAKNHIIKIDKSLTIPYDEEHSRFLDEDNMYLDSEDSDYGRFEEVTETRIKREVSIKETSSETGNTTTKEKSRTTTKYIEKTYPKFKLQGVDTPLKTLKFIYERKQMLNELYDYDYDRDKVLDDNGNIIEITTRTWRYRSFDKIVLKDIIETDNSTRFANFLEEIEIGVDGANEFKNIVSLFPAGYYVAADIQGSYINQYLDGESWLTDINGYSFGFLEDIVIEPSELLLPIPRFSQIDKRWANLPYGDSTIGRAGCGPTSASMVLTGLLDKVISPVEAVKFAIDNRCKVESGTSWNYFSLIGKHYNIDVQQLDPKNYRMVLEELKKGNPVIASMGPGHFTSAGHYIVLTGIDEDNLIIVNDSYDPLGIKNRSWDFKIILSEAKQFFVFKKT